MSCNNEIQDCTSDGLPKTPERPVDSDGLPNAPERPLDSDCCGQGCVPCVFDLYEEEVRIWEDECSKVRYGEIVEDHSEVNITCNVFVFFLCTINFCFKNQILFVLMMHL